jgi:hypothetical protein
MVQKLKFGGSKMGRIMKRLVSVKGIAAQKVLEVYWKTTVDYAAYIINKYNSGKKLSLKERGIIEFIETIADRIEKLPKGDLVDENRLQGKSVDSCS